MASFGRQVADAYISVHGDLAPFRRDLRLAEGYLQSFGRKMKGLAGLNVLEDTFSFGIRFMQNIDRNAIVIARWATMVGTALAATMQFIGAVATISQDLAALSGIGFLAPGFLTAFGIAMGVTVAAFKDMKTVLADLGPAFSGLQDRISDRFWDRAADPIRRLTNNLLPTLERELGNTATSMGNIFAEIASSFQREATPERVTLMFTRMNSALDIARGAIAPFTRAMVNLGEVGSKSFERFASWIVELSTRFDNFVTRSINNGDMDRWIENAIEGFKNVGRAISGAVGIVNAIGDAFRNAGGGGLAEFAAGLQAADEIMNSERFQSALTNLFIGARAAMDGFFSGLGRLGPAFESLGPTFIAVGGTIGQILDTIGILLADALMSPALQSGFQTFMSDVSTSLRNLGPAVGPFTESLGGLLELMGQVLRSVSNIGAQLLIEWGPVLDGIADKLGTMVGPLETTLSGLITTLTPVLQSFSDNVLGPVVTIINESVLPAIGSIAKAVGPTLMVMFEALGAFLRDDLSPAFAIFREDMKTAGEQGPEFGQQVGDAMKTIEDFLNTASSPQDTYAFLNSDAVRTFNDEVNQGLENFWRDVGTNYSNGVKGLNTDVNTWFSNIWNDVRTGAQTGTAQLNEAVNQGLADLWTGFTAGWNDGFATFNADVNRMAGEIWTGFVNGLTTGAVNIAASVIEGFTGWVNSIREFFGIHSPSTLMAQMGTDIVQGFINGIQLLIGQIAAVAGQIVQGFISGFTGMVEFLGQVWANISASFMGFIGGFVAAWNGFWAGLGPMVLGAMGSVGAFLGGVWAQITGSLAGFAAGFMGAWNALWSGVGQFLSSAWNNIVNFVQSGISRAQSILSSGMSAIGSAWSSEWSKFTTILSNAWNNAVNFVQSGIQRAQSAVASGLSAISSVWNSIWSNISSFISNAWSNITSFVSSGISRAVSAIAGGMGSIMGSIAGGFGNVVGTIAGAMGSMVGAVAGGVGNVIGQVIGMASRVIGAVSGMAGQMVSAGINMMAGFVNGIASMAGRIVQSAVNAVGGAINAVRNLLNLGSPSKLFRQFGEWTGEGLAIGMDNMQSLIARTAEDMASAATNAFSSTEMFKQGRGAVESLAAGMESNAQKLSDIVADMTPTMTAKFEAMGSLPSSAPTDTSGGSSKTIVFEQGAFALTTPVKDPALVASMVIDEFANNSTF